MELKESADTQISEISTKYKFIIAIVAIGLAPFSLDIGEIPVTFQTLMLFTAAVFLKPTEALFFGFGYLLLGAIGVPVFAGFESGFAKLFGSTAGFLWAFPFICLFISWVIQFHRTKFIWLVVAFLLAHVVLLLPGFLILFLTLENTDLIRILTSLLPGLIVKSILGPVLVTGIQGILQK